MNIQLIILTLVVVLALWLISAYNVLVRSRNRVKEAWSDIDIQLKRRHDLIPNLIETVKGYMEHERGTLEKVIQARSQAMNAQSIGEHGQAENMLSGALKSLFALSENYPQLRAVESFTKFQDELSDTENKIQAARRFYNTNVLDLNNKIEQVPTNIIALRFGFKKSDFFDLESEEERKPVKVNF